MSLVIQSSRQHNHCLLQIIGSVDLAGQRTFSSVLETCSSDISIIDMTIDVHQIDFIGSGGVSAILNICHVLYSREGRLRIVGCSPRTARIFHLLRVDFLLRPVEQIPQPAVQHSLC